MSRQLPPQPHLDVLKKQARQLLNDHQARQPDAVARLRAALADLPPSAVDGFTLRNAQQVVAREYGYTSWQALADHVVRPAGEDPPQLFSPRHVHYEKLVRDLVEALGDGRVQSFGRLGEDFSDRMAAAYPSAGEGGGGEHSLDQARLAVAAQSGCDSWEALAEAVGEPGQMGPVNLEQLRSFERMHAELAPLLAPRIAAIADTGRPVHAETAFTDQTSYGEFVISLSVPTYIFRFAVDGLGNDMVVSLGTPLVDGLLADSQGVRATRIADLGEGLARDLESIWNPLTQFSVGQIQPHTDPFAVGAVPMYEIGVLIAFQAGTAEGELSGLVEIFYPGSAIRGVMDSLSASQPGRHGDGAASGR